MTHDEIKKKMEEIANAPVQDLSELSQEEINEARRSHKKGRHPFITDDFIKAEIERLKKNLGRS